MREFLQWTLTLGLAWTAEGCVPQVPGDPVCVIDTQHPLDPQPLVKDLSLGDHSAGLTWIETGEQTDLQVSATFDGPAFKASEDCTGRYQVSVSYRADSADGLVSATEDREGLLDHELRLPDHSVSFAFDPGPMLAGGVAPEQPELVEQKPSLSFVLERDANGWKSGTIRAITESQALTLAVISFGEN